MEIFAAINRLDLAAVQACVESGTDINCPDPCEREKPLTERTGWSPLETALDLDPSPEKTRMLSWLLEAGAQLDPLTAAMSGNPPICVLATQGDAAGLEVLLKAGADPGSHGERGSALGLAVKSGNLAAVHCLLAAGASFPSSGPRACAFFLAAAPFPEMVDLLAEHGVDYGSCSTFPEATCGLLDHAFWTGDRKHHDFLLSRGVDPGDTTWDKTCQLLFMGTEDVFARHLQQEQPDLDKPHGWNDWKLVQLAVQLDHVGRLRLLLNAGAPLKIAEPEPPWDGRSLLHTAASCGSVQCLKLLLELGLPVDQTDKLGTTPLMEACQGSQLEAVRMLLEAGASVHQVNEFRDTALNQLGEYWRKSSPCLEILKLLHHYGADLNHADNLREGIVKDVAAVGDGEALRWLVEQGADLHLNCPEGTPLRHAVLNDDLACMEILLRGGADPNQRLEDDETVLFDAPSARCVRMLLEFGADPALQDNLFGRTAEEAIRDPLIKAAFHP